MTDLEKLARRICWLEFPKPPKDQTEAGYWLGVSPDKKREYTEDAEWLCWMLPRLTRTRTGDSLLTCVISEIERRVAA